MTTTIEIDGTEYEVALDVPATTPLRAAYLDAVRGLLLARDAAEEAAEAEADEAAEAARLALHDSSEDEHWIVRDAASGVTQDLGVEGGRIAIEAAREWVEEGDYDDITRTIWCDADLRSETGYEERVTVSISPREPACRRGREHDWQSPHEIVGGLAENPGVWGHGGGVTIDEVCAHCGCERRTDTWAQRLDTGEQGLTSIEYSRPTE